MSGILRRGADAFSGPAFSGQGARHQAAAAGAPFAEAAEALQLSAR